MKVMDWKSRGVGNGSKVIFATPASSNFAFVMHNELLVSFLDQLVLGNIPL